MKQVMQESLLIKLPVIIGDLFLLNLSWDIRADAVSPSRHTSPTRWRYSPVSTSASSPDFHGSA
ncbi:MAG: hypothetical protein ACLTG8_00960 [Alistipes finegoldii]|uniref:hypothetical protein n=1 Tax=Alistipes finegoldii TaxID=214856 RepID=UPI003990E39E